MFLLASDLHLCPARPGTVHLFERFLAGARNQDNVDAIYLLGDVFEYWAGDDDLSDTFNGHICRSLEKVSAAGTAVLFMPGNRDFLIGDGFFAATGARPLADEVVVNLAGTQTLLMHGDTLCTDDHEYQSFRNKVRSAEWLAEFLSQPLATRRAHIEELRLRSTQEKTVKPAAIMDVNDAAVIAAMRRHEVSRLVHGHTHRPAHHIFPCDDRPCERWVLPEWNTTGGYLACDASGCRLVRMD